MDGAKFKHGDRLRHVALSDVKESIVLFVMAIASDKNGYEYQCRLIVPNDGGHKENGMLPDPVWFVEHELMPY